MVLSNADRYPRHLDGDRLESERGQERNIANSSRSTVTANARGRVSVRIKHARWYGVSRIRAATLSYPAAIRISFL